LQYILGIIHTPGRLEKKHFNQKEWSNLKASPNSPGIDVYFAYQTFAGAIMHLVILGAIMGLFLGSIGGATDKTLRIIKK
jgi:hypothetical protein